MPKSIELYSLLLNIISGVLVAFILLAIIKRFKPLSTSSKIILFVIFTILTMLPFHQYVTPQLKYYYYAQSIENEHPIFKYIVEKHADEFQQLLEQYEQSDVPSRIPAAQLFQKILPHYIYIAPDDAIANYFDNIARNYQRFYNMGPQYLLAAEFPLAYSSIQFDYNDKTIQQILQKNLAAMYALIQAAIDNPQMVSYYTLLRGEKNLAGVFDQLIEKYGENAIHEYTLFANDLNKRNLTDKQVADITLDYYENVYKLSIKEKARILRFLNQAR